MTNVFDAANRLTSTTRASTTLQVAYNGLNDRVRQTVGATTTSFILDIAGGLPEVISTTRGTTYLHLPGVIMAQNANGQRVYLLPDGLGSIRQVISGTNVVAQRDFDPYGNPISTPSVSVPPYGFTGEWWEQDAQLLHLRARWYLPGEGIFLSKDAWAGDEARSQSMNGWSYVEGNPVRYSDPSGRFTFEQVEDPTKSTFYSSPFVNSDTYFLSPQEAKNIYGIGIPMRVSMGTVVDPTGEGLTWILLFAGGVMQLATKPMPGWFMGRPQIQGIHAGNYCDTIGNQEQGPSRSFDDPMPAATPSWGDPGREGEYFRPGKLYSSQSLEEVGAKRIRQTTGDYVSDEFKDFLRSNGYGYKKGEWAYVMETWILPNGTRIEQYFWVHKSGVIFHHAPR